MSHHAWKSIEFISKFSSTNQVMLQVISGRFWNQVERFDVGDEVLLYSTCGLSHQAETLSGNVTPSNSTPLNSDELNIRCAKFSYMHGFPIPAGGIRPGVDVAPPGEEIEAQMAALLTVYTERFWFPESKTVANLVERNKKSPAYLPFLVAESEVNNKHLTLFINNAVNLSRENYKAVSIASLALQDAIQTSFISYDAAFAMAVFAIESLVPNTTPSWQDAPESTTQPIDKILQGHEEIAHKIRSTLIKDRYFKLQANFVKFTKKHISGSFYRSSAGVRRSDLDKLLRNAYVGRSKYAHALTAIQRPSFTMDQNQSVIWDKGEPQFTLQGVILLACNIIRSYIDQEPHTEKEDGVPWYKNVPGVANMQLDYEYWLWKPEVFSENTNHRALLCDILRYSMLLCIGAKERLIDFRPGLQASMARAGQMKKEDRLSLICIVYIWQRMAPDLELDRADRFLQKYKDILKQPSPEALILHVWMWFKTPWTAEVSAQQWKKYMKQRYGTGKLRVMHSIEAAVQGAIANSFLSNSDVKEYEQYCNSIADDDGGRPLVVQHIESSIEKRLPLSISLLIGLES